MTPALPSYRRPGGPHLQHVVRLAVAVALVLAGSLSFATAGAGTASAASYRYWSYWLGSDTGWAYASWGPASLRPADGSVEGWRFGVGSGSGDLGLAPRTSANFESICSGTSPSHDTKRVGIVIDPGVVDHAPPGESPPGMWAMCVQIDEAATGADILRAAASVRTNQGMVCGVGGYPATECAVVISTPTAPNPEPTAQPTPSRTPAPTTTATTAPQTSTPPATTSNDASGSTPTAAPPTTSRTPGTPAAPSPATEPVEGETPTGAPGSDTAASDADGPQPSTTPRATGGTSTTPEPEVSIVAAPVVGDGGAGGSGPMVAVMGGVLIAALVGAGVWVRRRSAG